MRRMLLFAALAATLGTGCGRVHRNAAGVYAAEPVVALGVFTKVGRAPGEPWIFNPKVLERRKVPMRMSPDTNVLSVHGEEVGLEAIQPGQAVRVVYNLLRDGTGLVERIDIVGEPRRGLHRW
jgi:hypothetical protein